MATSKVSRIVIADDHPVVLDGLTNLLAPEKDLQLVGKATNGSQLLEVLRTKDVDLVVTDISMPEMNGIESTRKMRELYPELKILALSMHDSSDYITSILQAGANGYLIKNTGRQEVLKAIRTILGGKTYYSPKAAQAVMDNMHGSASPSIELSEREIEIVCHICNELTTREIAEKLFLSFHTVEKHRKNIIAKIGVRNTAGLVKWAVQEGVCK